MNTPIIKREVNLNTIVMAVGFLATFGGIVTSYSNLQSEQKNFGAFIEEQKAVNARLDQRIDTHDAVLNTLPQTNYQVAQLEEASKSTADRISSVTDSYSNQFSDIRAQLGSIQTQMALVKQSLDRIEAWSPDRRSEALRPSLPLRTLLLIGRVFRQPQRVSLRSPMSPSLPLRSILWAPDTQRR